MIPDQQLRLAETQSLVTNANTTVVCSNTIDLDTLRNIGVGTPLYVRIRFDSAIAQSASGGSNIFVVFADNEALTSNKVTLAQLGLVYNAVPPANGVLYIGIPPIARVASATSAPQSAVIPGNAKKYFGVYIDVFTQAFTAGSWTVDVVSDVNMVEHTYAGGFVVK